jgi:hypothetical protein
LSACGIPRAPAVSVAGSQLQAALAETWMDDEL